MGTVRQRRKSKHGAFSASSKKSKRKVAERRYKVKTAMSSSGRKSWNDKLTVDEMYGTMGLASKANSRRTDKERVKRQVEGLEKRELQVPRESQVGPTRRVLPEVEVKLVEAMLAKYGTDFDRMVADVRRNVYQWTKKQLERKLALYMEIAQDLGFLEGEGSKEGATNSSKRSRKTRGGTAKQ